MSVYIENFETIFGIKNNIQVLRNKVLELAIQGKLVEQDLNDEPASELVKKIQVEKDKLVKEGKIKKQKPLKPIDKEEIPFELPESWAVLKIGDIAKIITKGSTPTTYGYQYTDNGINFLKVENVKRGQVLLDSLTHFIDEETHEFLKRSQLEIDDVLFSIAGTIGEICIIKEEYLPANTNQAFAIIRGTGQILNPKYLEILLKNLKKSADEKARGGAMNNISLTDISDFVALIPPLEEQQRIITKNEFLMSEIDKLEKSLQNKDHLMELIPKAVIDAIGNCQTGEELKEQLQFVIDNFEVIFQIPDSMQELRNIVLQLAIEGKLVPQDTTDEPAAELVKRIQVAKDKLVKEGKIKKQKLLEPIEEDEISFEIPESWKWVRLGTIISFQGGYAYKSNSYIEQSHYQIIRLGNVKNDMILINTSPVYIPNNIAFETTNYKISVGDILVTMTGTKNKRDYFYTCRVCEEDLRSKELFLNQRVGNLKSDKEINSYYINLVLKAKSILKSIFATETGTANQGNIGSGSIENLIIPLPPVNEQHRIVKKVESIMNLIDQMEAELKHKFDLVEKMASV